MKTNILHFVNICYNRFTNKRGIAEQEGNKPNLEFL